MATSTVVEERMVRWETEALPALITWMEKKDEENILTMEFEWRQRERHTLRLFWEHGSILVSEVEVFGIDAEYKEWTFDMERVKKFKKDSTLRVQIVCARSVESFDIGFRLPLVKSGRERRDLKGNRGTVGERRDGPMIVDLS